MIESWFSLGEDSRTHILSVFNPNIILVLNNTSNNTGSTNITDKCHPLLFESGLSRESNGTFVYGLCPDTWISFALCLIFVIVYLSIISVSFVGVIWKRKSGHIQARNPIYLYFALMAGVLFILGTMLRVIVGRKIYSCGILTVCFFTLPPAIMLPTIFRLVRVYFMCMYKVNLLKTQMFDNSERALPKEVSLNDSSLSSNVTQMNSKSIFGLEDITDRQNNVTTMLSDVDTARTDFQNIEDITPSVPITSSNLVEVLPTDEMTTDFDNESVDISTWNMSDFKELKDITPELKRLKLFNFILGDLFIVLVYICSFLFGIVLWLVLGGIEEAVFNNSTDPSKSRIFLFDGGLLVFDRGCGMTTTCIVIVGVYSLFYVFTEIAFLILSFFADKDTWGIKRESLVLIIFQVIAIIFFIVWGLLDITERLIDYIVPTGFALWGYMLLELIICVTLPVLYSIRKDMKTKQPLTGLDKVLGNRKTYNILLDFARRRFVFVK